MFEVRKEAEERGTSMNLFDILCIAPKLAILLLLLMLLFRAKKDLKQLILKQAGSDDYV